MAYCKSTTIAPDRSWLISYLLLKWFIPYATALTPLLLALVWTLSVRYDPSAFSYSYSETLRYYCRDLVTLIPVALIRELPAPLAEFCLRQILNVDAEFVLDLRKLAFLLLGRYWCCVTYCCYCGRVLLFLAIAPMYWWLAEAELIVVVVVVLFLVDLGMFPTFSYCSSGPRDSIIEDIWCWCPT